ncbi:hotdog domain-containing protein [Anaerotignum sp.]
MNWTKIPGLSQADMETFFHNAMKPNSELKHHGVIPRMDPRFVSCDFEKGTVDMAFDVQEWELNPEDILHGGITSTALDTSMGMLALYYTHLIAPTVVTVTMNVSYLKPITPGDTFHIQCQLDSVGRTLATVKAEVRLERDDILACIATATFMAVDA